jgi:hypothetical protein
MRKAVRYLCSVRLDGVYRIFLWDSGDDGFDRVVVDDQGMLVEFPSESAAREARRPAGYELSPEPVTHYDLDTVQSWCASSTASLDCATLLNAWNLLGDLPHGENLFTYADERAMGVYDKLFFGCNLPAITPSGRYYVPTWTASEITALKRVLQLGLAEFRARLRRPERRVALSGLVPRPEAPALKVARRAARKPRRDV